MSDAMASFGQLIVTNLGLQEQYKAQAGIPLKFKRIAMGSGNFSGNITTLTKLVTENVSVDISKGYIQNDAYTVEGYFTNEDLQSGFAWREIGLYIEDQSGNEILYCYANAGDTYDYIPATTDERYSKYIRIATAIGNAENVTIVENESYSYVDIIAFSALSQKVDGLMATIVDVTLPASAWVSKSGMNIIAISNSAITGEDNEVVEVSVSHEATLAQKQAWAEAGVISGKNTQNTLELNAIGIIPTVDIPIKLIIRKK